MAKFTKLKMIERYRLLSFWNKVAFLGSVASIGALLYSVVLAPLLIDSSGVPQKTIQIAENNTKKLDELLKLHQNVMKKIKLSTALGESKEYVLAELKEGRFSNAKRKLDLRQSEIETELAELEYLRGLVAHLTDDKIATSEHFANAHFKFPENIKYSYYYANSLVGLKEYTPATFIFEKLAKFDPEYLFKKEADWFIVVNNLSVLEHRADNHKKAISLLTEGVTTHLDLDKDLETRVKRTKKLMMLNLAGILSMVRALPEGLILFQFLLDFEELSDEQRADIATNYGFKLLELNQYNRAIAQFWSVLQMNDITKDEGAHFTAVSNLCAAYYDASLFDFVEACSKIREGVLSDKGIAQVKSVSTITTSTYVY